MTIRNNTTCTIYVGASEIRPGEETLFWDGMFSSILISSELGTCLINVEFSKRKIYNNSKLTVRETQEKDSGGNNIIIVEVAK